MTLRYIYIVRHGYRADWMPKPLPNPTGISHDPPLAPTGVLQSKELADFISHQDIKPSLIFTSPFYRCVETASPTSRELHIPIFIDSGLSEWFKKNRGPIPNPPSYKQLKSFFPTLSDEWEWNKCVVPNLEGEDEHDIFVRCSEFWQAFIPRVEAQFPHVESILLVSHAATKIALGMTLMGYTKSSQFIGEEHGGDGVSTTLDACTCSLDLFEKKLLWKINFSGNTGFLSSGKQMGWNFKTSKFVAGSKEDIAERRKKGLL